MNATEKEKEKENRKKRKKTCVLFYCLGTGVRVDEPEPATTAAPEPATTAAPEPATTADPGGTWGGWTSYGVCIMWQNKM